MKQNKKRRSFSIVSLVLMAFLALPSLIQLLHVANHLENDCRTAYESHIHVKELDCDFNKFNFSHYFYLTNLKIELLASAILKKDFSKTNNFNAESDSPLFSLRAPPSFS
jgi:hypothetical protein